MKDNSKNLEKDPDFINDIVVKMRASQTHINIEKPEVFDLSQDDLNGAIEDIKLIAGKAQIDFMVGALPIEATLSNDRITGRDAVIAAGARLAIQAVNNGHIIVGHEADTYIVDPKVTAQSLVNGGDFITVSY
ncbi:MAG TPA: hypothetical protein VLF79_02525 [Candidatus Saccharimonadales bacterium]|nr:hypothetical protein [Candidatus Saccharimonadales bacterium]